MAPRLPGMGPNDTPADDPGALFPMPVRSDAASDAAIALPRARNLLSCAAEAGMP